MAGAWGIRRRHPAMVVAGALVAASLAVAALTLLAPSSPSYDPFAWIVWGRELTGGTPFGLAGGPSWKPLPVLFTVPFSFAGGAAPALWLVVARAGLLLALAGAAALAARLAGRWAGVTAALALLLLAELVSLAWRGASEPLLLAALLWAGERHLAGARRSAFALGVAAALIRPEVAPFLALYALFLWRAGDARERWLIVGGLALLPLLWIGIPALGGDPLAAATTASNPGGPSPSDPAWATFRRGLGLAPALLWALALAAVALRPRDRVVRTLALAAAAWLALVVVMAGAGYAGVARYMLPAAAVVCVLAGVGVATIAAWASTRRGDRAGAPAVAAVAAIALLALLGLTAHPTRLGDEVREGTAVAHAHDELRAAVVGAGGTAAVRRCALRGWVAINHTTQTALAWELDVGLDRVAHAMSRPGLLVVGRRSTATGSPPPIALTAPARLAPRARAGAWKVFAVREIGAPFPPACGAWKASGSPRRIPNI